MAVLVGVQNSLRLLTIKQNQFEELFARGSLSLEEKYKVEILKEEMLNCLSNILATHCNEVLSNSFYIQVNYIEEKMCEILKVKIKELELSRQKHKEAIKEAKSIIAGIYSIDILQNSVHVALNIEKRLLDIKNNVVTINLSEKKICAIRYLKDKIKIYNNELKKVLEIVYSYKLKQELPFEKKKEIYDSLCKISSKQQTDKNHSKMFNEDVTVEDDTMYTLDYIKWFEAMFIEQFDVIGLNLNSYFEDLYNLMNNQDIYFVSITDFVDFITKKYLSEIDLFLNFLVSSKKKANEELKNQLNTCYAYEGITELELLITRMEKNQKLPYYLQSSRYRQKIENLVFESNITIKDNVEIFKVLDELSAIVIEKFDKQKYLDMYEFNCKYKNKQIAQFRQYYIDILDQAREELIQKYVSYIEETMERKLKSEYNMGKINEEISIKEGDIATLQEILKYINDNYRDFNEENLKIFMETIEDRYKVRNLYNRVMDKKSNVLFKLKTKNVINKENAYIRAFIDNDEIIEKLRENIVKNITLENEDLKEEIEKLIK